MSAFRLRTKLQLSLLSILAVLTCATLLIVHHTVRKQVRKELFDDLHHSTPTFQKVLEVRERTLVRSAALVSNLPSLKAMMTTHDADTIQDASRPIWQLAGSEFFMLANSSGRVVALHTSAPGFARGMAEQQLREKSLQDESATWWFGGGHLYEVFLQPIYFGSPKEDRLLGILALGYEVDERLAREAARIASSDATIRYGDTVVVSTLQPSRQRELPKALGAVGGQAQASEVVLDGERYLSASLDLDRSHESPVQLTVLKSYDEAAWFLDRLNRLVLALGIAAVVFGAGLLYVIARTFTRPLENLAAGVKALERGNYEFPLDGGGDDEVALVTRAFRDMRDSLQHTQQKLLESERLATIGLMASSISHDLRHPLTAILANAEFLSENRLNGAGREEIYNEIRSAVAGMTDLIESLLEFSRGKESLQFSRGDVRGSVLQAVQAVRQKPELRPVSITVSGDGAEMWLDHRRLERVFYNLLVNACDACPAGGEVTVSLSASDDMLQILVCDNGPGIPAPIRERLFEPFVSYGKENGTGLGLTIARKIVENHGGCIRVAETSAHGTTFELLLPLNNTVITTGAVQTISVHDTPLVRSRDSAQ